MGEELELIFHHLIFARFELFTERALDALTNQGYIRSDNL
jgi:hypothetical protein